MSIVTYDASSVADGASTLNHTCGATANLLLVGVVCGSKESASGVTYNSVAMTQIGTHVDGFYVFFDEDGETWQTVGNRSSVWGLLNPTVGSSQAISASGVTGAVTCLFASSFVRAKFPTNFQEAEVDSSSGSISVTLTNVAVSSILWGVVGGGHMGGVGAWSATSGQTARQTIEPYGGGYGGKPCGSLADESMSTTTGSEAVSWTVVNSAGLTLHGIEIPALVLAGSPQWWS